MMINDVEARIEWASRVARQSEEMTIIAAATGDDAMKSELLMFADPLMDQVASIRALPARCASARRDAGRSNCVGLM